MAIKDYKNAIANYDISISRNSRLAEAYYNRGIAKIFVGNISGGLKDLGKAGELGIYDAYALMKKYSGERFWKSMQPALIMIPMLKALFCSSNRFKTKCTGLPTSIPPPK